MQALLDVVLPVFLVIGAGYVAVWRKVFSEAQIDALMSFTQNVAIPCLLFAAVSGLDLAESFDPALLFSFYSGATAGFLAGLLGARYLFGRPWEDSVAIGFAGLFANSVLLGLPITERAFGPEALDPNYAIIALYAPYCYLVGMTAMELVRGQGDGLGSTMARIARAILRSPIPVAILAGLAVNLTGLPIPVAALGAIELIGRAALPAALFGLGGILVRYRPEGDLKTVLFVMAVSLILHPAVTWGVGRSIGLTVEAFRSAVLTAAMAPGVNAYIFANVYGVAKRVVATTVLLATAGSVVTVWIWLALLP